MIGYLIFIAIYLISSYLLFRVYVDWVTDFGVVSATGRQYFVCFIAAISTLPLFIQLVSYILQILLVILQAFA